MQQVSFAMRAHTKQNLVNYIFQISLLKDKNTTTSFIVSLILIMKPR
jgi:hypothetical protein